MIYVKPGDTIKEVLIKYPILNNCLSPNGFFSHVLINKLVGKTICEFWTPLSSDLINKILNELNKSNDVKES